MAICHRKNLPEFCPVPNFEDYMKCCTVAKNYLVGRKVGSVGYHSHAYGDREAGLSEPESGVCRL